MKRKIIIFVTFLIFIVVLMFLIFGNKFLNKDVNSNKMTIDYVNTNFEIDLYDTKEKNSITFYATGKYIGNDKIIDYPNIKLRVKCSYTYEDVNQEYTDMVAKDVIVTKKKDNYIGEDTVDIKRDTINSYSCFYEIVEVSGSYRSDK